MILPDGWVRSGAPGGCTALTAEYLGCSAVTNQVPIPPVY
jgi:hypothetical protein